MASLVLLVSELLKHTTNNDLAFPATSLPTSSSCGATTTGGAPCFTDGKWVAKLPADRCKNEEFMEDLSELRVCVDLVWP